MTHHDEYKQIYHADLLTLSSKLKRQAETTTHLIFDIKYYYRTLGCRRKYDCGRGNDTGDCHCASCQESYRKGSNTYRTYGGELGVKDTLRIGYDISH